MEFFARLEPIAARWNVLRHPFYARWECGDLSRDELALYAGEYRHAVVALARAARTAVPVAGPEHAAEEGAHVALWDAFAHALDADLDREPRPETVECARAWGDAADPLESLAVLYAVESAQPAISRTKLVGLVDHYGFEPGSGGTSYFEVHAERDVEHAAEAREAIAAVAGDDDAERMLAAAEAALRGNWTLLDGVSA